MRALTRAKDSRLTSTDLQQENLRTNVKLIIQVNVKKKEKWSNIFKHYRNLHFFNAGVDMKNCVVTWADDWLVFNDDYLKMAETKAQLICGIAKENVE